jgi:hypothetical protein
LGEGSCTLSWKLINYNLAINVFIPTSNNKIRVSLKYKQGVKIMMIEE